MLYSEQQQRAPVSQSLESDELVSLWKQKSSVLAVSSQCSEEFQ
jgi:hypothetical protein